MWITFFRVSFEDPLFFENEGVRSPRQGSYPQLCGQVLSVLLHHMRFPAPAVYIDYSFRIWILPIRLWSREKSVFYRFRFFQDLMERVYGIWMG